MKKIVFLLVFLYGVDVPQRINFQGRLTDANNNPLTGNYSFSFKLYNVQTGGTELWFESKTLTVTNGYYTTNLGDAHPIPYSVFTSTGFLWLEVGVGGVTLTPRQRIVSNGYAISSQFANASAGDFVMGSGLLNASTFTSTTGSLRIAGTLTVVSSTITIGQGQSKRIEERTSPSHTMYISTTIQTAGGIIVDGSVGSAGGDAVVIRSGGDLKILNSNNTGSVPLYCDNDSVLGIGGAVYTSTYVLGIVPPTCYPMSINPSVAWKNNTIAEDWYYDSNRVFVDPYDFHPNRKIQIKVVVFMDNDNAASNFTWRDANHNVFGSWTAVAGGSSGEWKESGWQDYQPAGDYPIEFRISAYTDNSASWYGIKYAYILVRPQRVYP